MYNKELKIAYALTFWPQYAEMFSISIINEEN